MISFDEFIKQDDEEKYNNMQHDLLEIERLQKELEFEKSKNNEVREYIGEHTNYDNCESKNHLDLTDRDNILEILDKKVD